MSFLFAIKDNYGILNMFFKGVIMKDFANLILNGLLIITAILILYSVYIIKKDRINCFFKQFKYSKLKKYITTYYFTNEEDASLLLKEIAKGDSYVLTYYEVLTQLHKSGEIKEEQKEKFFLIQDAFDKHYNYLISNDFSYNNELMIKLEIIKIFGIRSDNIILMLEKCLNSNSKAIREEIIDTIIKLKDYNLFLNMFDIISGFSYSYSNEELVNMIVSFSSEDNEFIKLLIKKRYTSQNKRLIVAIDEFLSKRG